MEDDEYQIAQIYLQPKKLENDFLLDILYIYKDIAKKSPKF